MKVLIAENRRYDVVMKFLDAKYGDMTELMQGVRVPVGSKHFGFIDENGGKHAVFSYYPSTPVLHSHGSTRDRLSLIFGLDQPDAEGYLLTWLHKRFGVPRDIRVVWF